MVVVAAIALVAYITVEVANTPALTFKEALVEPPRVSFPVLTVNGNPETKIPAAITETDVEPDIFPTTVTDRPIFVYVPDDENVPTRVTFAPCIGVQVPSS